MCRRVALTAFARSSLESTKVPSQSKRRDLMEWLLFTQLHVISNDTLRQYALECALDCALECGGLAPLWPRSSMIDNKAAPGRRTPKSRQAIWSHFLCEASFRSCNISRSLTVLYPHRCRFLQFFGVEGYEQKHLMRNPLTVRLGRPLSHRNCRERATAHGHGEEVRGVGDIRIVGKLQCARPGSAHKRPPCASTMDRLIESPMPRPLGLVV